MQRTLLAVVLSFFLVKSVFCKEYVTCFINGQLGNQLFQVAAAVGYALDHDCEPVFPDIKNAINGDLNYRYFFHRLNTSKVQAEFDSYREKHSNLFSPIPYTKGKNLCLFGHFESDKYFAHHKEYIRNLFAPSEEVLCHIFAKYGDILKEPTVAVHVRTFIPDKRKYGIPFLGGANWNYFLFAMDYFPEHYHFLVFSDSIKYTKKLFPHKPNRKITFIEGNSHYIDFFLMSLCDHQIVSPESTFSWWAAWLNSNPNKIVILPDSWNGLKENDTIPEGWITLEKRPQIPLTLR